MVAAAVFGRDGNLAAKAIDVTFEARGASQARGLLLDFRVDCLPRPHHDPQLLGLLDAHAAQDVLLVDRLTDTLPDLAQEVFLERDLAKLAWYRHQWPSKSIRRQRPREEKAPLTPPVPPSGMTMGRKVSDPGKVPIMDGERIVCAEESTPQQYFKLIASGEPDEHLLEALEDYVKRQKRRLAGQPKTEKAAS
jgi:hypothetical protein